MLRAPQPRAIAGLTLAFILLSALLHFTFGGFGTMLHVTIATPIPQGLPIVVTIQRLATPTPRPLPSPTLTPPRVTLRPQAFPAAPVVRRRSRSRTGFAGQTTSAVKADGIPPAPPISATARPAIETPTPVETPVDARDRIVAATFRHEVRPVYPDIAKYGDQEGTVVVLAMIGPEGRVLSARIAQSSGSLAIDAEALRAAQASSYYPPEIDGKPAIMTYRIIYTFQLT